MGIPVLDAPQSRRYSSGGRKGFISGFVENIKQELAKNKEMKESIQKFRDEAKKLEESDALREARRKYVRFGGIPGGISGPRVGHDISCEIWC
ncbi:hypothetical protein BTVI_00942 [Pitangus sulphuratus]|nr:hypothetical protein BTVI_00942 [Pitangus sulphuratus]